MKSQKILSGVTITTITTEADGAAAARRKPLGRSGRGALPIIYISTSHLEAVDVP